MSNGLIGPDGKEYWQDANGRYTKQRDIENNRFTSANAPTAQEYGVGSLWIDGQQYWSDGESYTKSSKILSKKSRLLFALCGDSTMALHNLGGSCSISASGTTATVTRTNHAQTKGSRILILNADQPEFNGVHIVTSVLSSGTFTYELSQPASVSNATGVTIVNFLQNVKDSEFVSLAAYKSRKTISYAANFAQGGGRTEHLPAQIELLKNANNNLYSGKIDMVFCSIGINDAINDVPLETTKNNVISFIKEVQKLGIKLVMLTQFALSNSYTNWNATRVAVSRQYNEWLRNYCTENHILLIDANELTVDENEIHGNYISGYSDDGIHPNKVAAEPLSNEIKTKIFDNVDIIETENTNLLANSYLSGSGGTKSGPNITGSVPNNFTLKSLGGGSQAVNIAIGNGPTGYSNKVVIDLTAAAALDSFEFYIDQISTFEIGKQYKFIADLTVSGSGELRDLFVYISKYVDSVFASSGSMHGTENHKISAIGRMLIETPPIDFVSGTTAFRPYIRMRLLNPGNKRLTINRLQLIEV